MRDVTKMKDIYERIHFLNIKICKNVRALVISVYAPVLDFEEFALNQFYEELEDTLLKQTEYNDFIIGDWNSVVGANQYVIENVDNHGVERRNSNGKRLVDFCVKSNLKVANTFFPKTKNSSGLGTVLVESTNLSNNRGKFDHNL